VTYAPSLGAVVRAERRERPKRRHSAETGSQNGKPAFCIPSRILCFLFAFSEGSLFGMIATGAARRACSPGTMQHSSGRAVMDMDIPITLKTICGQHCPERWHLACSTAQHATRTQIRRWCTRFAALAVVAPHGRPPRAAPRETRCSGPRRKSSRPQATTRREVYSP